jgi:single-stranded-DNA-specific exonuclease
MMEAGLPPLTAAVLSARGVSSAESARHFLSTDPALLHDPWLLKDMDRAVARIHAAMDRREKIAVFGDYDVDGITSTALLTSYLLSEGCQVVSHIPNRLTEGYGLNNDALVQLADQGVTLVITVDCGITAVEEVALAGTIGMDVVITDHHECKETLPDAVAVVNPHRPDCPYPFKALAGVGVALKLVVALGQRKGASEALLRSYVDLAAIGTVADVMELVDENRVIVDMGLTALVNAPRPGLEMLLREAGLTGKPVTASTIGYSIAPRLNASGRMGCADLACELLLTASPARGEELAKDLCALNRERQAIEQEIYAECVTRLAGQQPKDIYSIVFADAQWHQGVVGIVASRLSEQYSCPVFMICLDGGKGKGSCRSYGGINLFQVLESCSNWLESFGGHELAAGFTILEENIPAFRQQVDAEIRAQMGASPISSNLAVDLEVTNPALLNIREVTALNILEPTGTGNPKPVFQLSGAHVVSVTSVGGGRHTKFRVQKDGCVFDSIFFSATPQEAGLTLGARVDLAFSPSINEYRGLRSVQLQIIDVRPAMTQAQVDQRLYQRYLLGEVLTPQEADALLPRREDFIAVWRYLKQHTAPGLVEDTAPRLARKIARTFGIRETYPRTRICLDVMHERGLITLSAQTDHLQICIRPTTGKVDLEASYIMQKLHELAEN